MDRDTRDMLLETASRFFAERAGKGADAGGRADQHRHDQVAPGGLERTHQRVRVARVGDGTGDRRQGFAAL